MAETITYSSQGSKEGRNYFRVQISYTDIGTSQETVIQLPPGIGKRYWHLEAFHIVRTGGTASNWAPRLGNAAGFAADSISELMAYDSAAVTTPINDMWSYPGLPTWSDSAFKLYFVPAFDAGSDNDGHVDLIFSLE
ncbi:MAG: hypothetical protein Unbinned80contig1000_2 [Prokaryotic dsDNA virus sp.]|nr:MAG: hypothetical protein Unbinned80contig1000_2 [Prokaryotic dsDNA virus sp.]